jgi:predicted Zn-dependent protease
MGKRATLLASGVIAFLAAARAIAGDAMAPAIKAPSEGQGQSVSEEERLAQAYELFFDARRAAGQHRMAEAVRFADMALERRSDLADIRYGAASYRLALYQSAGFNDAELLNQASAHFQWIVDHAPGSPWAGRSQSGLGFVHQSLAWAAEDTQAREARIKEMFRCYRAASEADKSSAEPFLQLAEATIEFGYDDKTAAYYAAEAAKRLGADDPAVKAAEGLILMKRGAWADAASALRDAADRDRNNPWYWHQLAYSYTRLHAEAAAKPNGAASPRAEALKRAADSYARRGLALDPDLAFLSGLERRHRVDAAFVEHVRALAAADKKEKEGAPPKQERKK